MNQERSYHGLSSSPSLASPPLHASPSLGMLGLDNTESTPSRTLRHGPCSQ